MKVVLLLAVIVNTMALDLPNNFKTCKMSDPKIHECLKVAVQDAVVSMAKGLKSFKILPLEPLAVDSLKIGNPKGGAVNLNQEYRNVKVYGLTKDLQILKYQVDWDNLILRTEAFNPQVDFVADYKLNGNILLLPIRGEGRCNISMHDLATKHELFFERLEKDGDIYMRMTKYIIYLEPKHVTIQFDNLFNGDSTLGKQMNGFLNENSDLVFKEFKPHFEETFGLIFAKLTNDIFTRVPMNKIFK